MIINKNVNIFYFYAAVIIIYKGYMQICIYPYEFWKFNLNLLAVTLFETPKRLFVTITLLLLVH